MRKYKILYIFKDKNAPHIKIGVAATDVLSRAERFREEIDHEQSVYVECATNAWHLEQALHAMFKEHRATKPKVEGYTEWFGEEIREELLAFLSANAQRLGVSEPRPLPPAKPRRYYTPRGSVPLFFSLSRSRAPKRKRASAVPVEMKCSPVKCTI
jgi:T5orf172 domain